VPGLTDSLATIVPQDRGRIEHELGNTFPPVAAGQPAFWQVRFGTF
jgi:hypothetical protein